MADDHAPDVVETAARALAHDRARQRLERDGRISDEAYIACTVDATWRDFERDAQIVLATVGLFELND